MWLDSREHSYDRFDACMPLEGVQGTARLQGTCRTQMTISLGLHLRAGAGADAIEMVSTKMQVILRVFEFGQANQSEEAESEPEPEPEPEPRLPAPLLVGHIIGVMTPERHRRKGHATLALRECISLLRLHGVDLVTLDCTQDVSTLYAKAGFVAVHSDFYATTYPFWLCWPHSAPHHQREDQHNSLMDMFYVVSERGAAAVAEHMAGHSDFILTRN